MGRYTITVREILEEVFEEDNPGQYLDIHDDDAVVQLAKDNLFDKALSRIDNEFRDLFVLGFVRKFIRREIGVPDEDDFIYNVGADIITNADYINTMYKAAAEGMFSNKTSVETMASGDVSATNTEQSSNTTDRNSETTVERLRTELKESLGTRTGSGQDTAKTDDVNTDVLDGENVTSATGDDKVKTDSTDVDVLDSAVKTTASGEDVTTGQDVDTKEGSDVTTVKHEGEDTFRHGRIDTKGGSTTEDYGDGLEVKNAGPVITDNTSTKSFPSRKTNVLTTNRALFNETPDDAIIGIESEEYLSSASTNRDNVETTEEGTEVTVDHDEVNDTSSSTTKGVVTRGDNTTNTASGDDVSAKDTVDTTTFDAGIVGTLDKVSTVEHGKIDDTKTDDTHTVTVDGEVVTEYGKIDTLKADETRTNTIDGQLVTEYGKIDTDANKDEGSGSENGTDVVVDGIVGSSETEGGSSGRHSDETTSTTIHLNYNELMEYGSLLDGVWVLFRHNFFALY